MPQARELTMAKTNTRANLARGLGWFGIGLGLVELLAPQRVERGAGLEGRRGLLRWFGAREIVSGIPLVIAGNPAPWLWGRVVGDALDGGVLARGMLHANPRRKRTMAAALAIAPVVALDLWLAVESLSRKSR
jgi:hypothetical protein